MELDKGRRQWEVQGEGTEGRQGAKAACPHGEDPSGSCGLREEDAVSQVAQQEGAENT